MCLYFRLWLYNTEFSQHACILDYGFITTFIVSVLHGFFKVSGFHHGILKLAMEPSLLGTALMEGGPDRKIKLDRSPGIDEVIFLICAYGKSFL